MDALLILPEVSALLLTGQGASSMEIWVSLTPSRQNLPTLQLTVQHSRKLAKEHTGAQTLPLHCSLLFNEVFSLCKLK
jgi:hypothetical protein